MGAGRIAYLVSWFPVVTETFILDEVRDLRARGVPVEVFPLFGAHGGEPQFETTRGRQQVSLLLESRG